MWGPLVFTLLLAILLSAQSPAAAPNATVSPAETVFAVVFCVVGLGSLALTLNVLLLGGQIIFFQSLSVLGYCLFPLVVAAVLNLASRNGIYRVIVLSAAVSWALRCSVPFLSHAVSERRRALAVYPLVLLYVSLAWLSLEA